MTETRQQRRAAQRAAPLTPGEKSAVRDFMHGVAGGLAPGGLTQAQRQLILKALPHMSDEDRAELSTLLRHVPPAPPAITFKEFVNIVEPRYRWWWHNEVLGRRLQQVADGTLRNIVISMPPRHGKSLTVSRLFVAYYRYRFPSRHIGLASYTGELAFKHSRAAKRYFLKAGGALLGHRDERTTKYWESSQGGDFWVVGAGGSATGSGGHLLVLDDPLKDSEEAKSDVIRNSRLEWLKSTWLTRAEPNAAKLIVATRWHPDDPSGYVLKQAEHEFGEKWLIINFEAIRSDEPYLVQVSGGRNVTPESIGCRMEPDPRPVWNGQPDYDAAALCPARVSMRELLAKKVTSGSYWWNAMYQGRPKNREGNLFKEEWFTVLKAIPANVRARVRAWDLAGTDEFDKGEGDPDYTVGARMSDASDGKTIIEHVERFRKSPGSRNARMKVVADADQRSTGRRVRQVVERPSGEQGKQRAAAIVRALRPHPVTLVTPLGDKEERAESFQAQAEAGNVCLVDGEWVAAFIDELTSFPFGSHDDILDAVAHGYNALHPLGGERTLVGARGGEQRAPAGTGIPE